MSARSIPAPVPRVRVPHTVLLQLGPHLDLRERELPFVELDRAGIGASESRQALERIEQEELLDTGTILTQVRANRRHRRPRSTDTEFEVVTVEAARLHEDGTGVWMSTRPVTQRSDGHSCW